MTLPSLRRVYTALSSLGVLLLCTILLTSPFSSHATQTKTYSFTNPSTYTTSGSLSFTREGATSETFWYNEDWSHRLKLTVKGDYITEDLTDFPLLVDLGDSDTYTTVYNTAKPEGQDLLFTQADGTTKLSHERESKSKIWVKVPQLKANQDTTLYLYYGNPNADDQQNAQDVWSNGYAGVWHMNQSPTGQILDSTSNNNHGTSSGSMTESDLVNGQTDKAVEFDGVNDYLDFDPEPIGTPQEVTIQAWSKFDRLSSGAQKHAIIHLSSNSFLNGFYLIAETVNQPSATFNNGSYQGFNATESIQVDKWHSLASTFSRSAGKARIFFDGDLSKEINQSVSITYDGSRDLRFGTMIPAHGSRYLDGFLDEVRISTTSRSSSRISAEYSNQCNCKEDFLTISSTPEEPAGTEEPTPGDTIITLKQPLPFTTLTSFTPITSHPAYYQLSNDNGTTWYYYQKKGWTKTSQSHRTYASSANDVAGHLNTFPKGAGNLLFRVILPEDTTITSLTIGYIPTTTTTSTNPNTPTSLNDPRIKQINSLYRQVYGTNPTVDQWLFWATRMLNGEKTTLPEVLGAMEYRKIAE